MNVVVFFLDHPRLMWWGIGDGIERSSSAVVAALLPRSDAAEGVDTEGAGRGL